jgi:peptidoglycan hydrolase-like protein with peptidoglycan-binding domain
MPPTTNLQPGQTGPEVKKLQDFLVSKGLMTPQQVATGPGIYGPQTTAAVKKFQEQNGVDNTTGPGYWGPKTIKAASGASAITGAGNASSMPTGNTDTKSLKEQVFEGMKQDPFFQDYLKYNTEEDIAYASSTGDLSGIVNQYGQPFSLQEQQDALEQAKKMDEAYYTQLKEKETADAEASLAQKQADYQQYLLNSGQQFEQDKAQADQSAADRGVLFSGSRVQKEKNLQRAYEQDQAYKQSTMARGLESEARDYQYKYGNDAVNTLSKYYKAGSNIYNPNVARGGVSSGSLSSYYDPSKYNFAGTRIGEQAGQANKQATQILTNKANKLLSTGYKNQIK